MGEFAWRFFQSGAGAAAPLHPRPVLRVDAQQFVRLHQDYVEHVHLRSERHSVITTWTRWHGGKPLFVAYDEVDAWPTAHFSSFEPLDVALTALAFQPPARAAK